MSFTAAYRSACAACPEPIVPGQEARYDANDEPVHVRCPQRVEHPVCTDCWLVHAPGACDR